MDNVSQILQKVKVPTHCLKSLSLQEVLTAATKYGRSTEVNEESWTEVVQMLWTHLHTGLVSFDDQLLCATCFYLVLSLSGKQDLYISVILDIIGEGIALTEKDTKNLEMSHTVSLMYGMFQSSFLTSNIQVSHVSVLLNAIFNLLKLMAYEYSRYTFIVFKSISSFKKVIDTDLQECLFNEENIIKLLNIVNHNWENPLTGVRDLNKDIFRTLISIMKIEMFEKVLEEIDTFYWNKAKYLMIAEILKQYTGNLNEVIKENWLDGLFHSLNKPGLVSAGADMYNAIFRRFKSKNEWCDLFLKPAVKMLNEGPQKAIENFGNYWCLSTLKGFPTLTAQLLEELECLDDSELKLYSSLRVMKAANKLGFINKDWEMKDNYVEKTVINGMQHCENTIRIISFEILCVTNSKAMPTKSEYALVLDYITNNINSDCTVLRLSMLNNISCFLTQLHINYLNYIKQNRTYDVENLKTFCFEFQDFITTNFKITGNYQRKITCVKIAQIFLNDLGDVPLKRQKQTCKGNESIIHTLEKGGHWILCDKDVILNIILLLKDPADDVRENAIRLLFNNYSVKLGRKHMMELLINEGLSCLNSKFFYQISCGQSIFKLIVNLLLEKQQFDSTFKSVDDVFDFAFKELITEYNMHRDIVRSIRTGKQLHSFINILFVVLDVCHQNKHAINITDEQLLQLLEILEGTSNQFAWEQQSTTSSNFSEISDMVNSIIASSEIKFTDHCNDQTKITGLHQLVLNCLWLNVKASCDLASLLIKCQKGESQINISQKALDLMGHVLETCRHKGAIEATGAALGQSIRHLTSLPEETQISKLPMTFLKKKLEELISEATNMASVTRRGAGLSIMVHRIVSNDVKRGKPLFHYFMTKTLKACNDTNQTPLEATNNTENEKDLPKAVYIHFLTRIVTDSTLSSDIMFYSTDLAELAFSNLTSSYWQIRNAALQLYGALIQKLIGQKKASGSDEETVATVACDELRTHTPKLWHYVQCQLRNVDGVERLQHHSNLVPTLNMLASLAQRYNFSYDLLNQKEADIEMMRNLMLLLDSPIYTVRRLTAKSISNMYLFEEIYEDLIKKQYLSENYIHGSLILISNYNKLYNLDNSDKYKNELEKLKLKYENIFEIKHSYISKEVFDTMFKSYESSLINVKQIFTELDNNCEDIGVQHWANNCFGKYIQQVTWDVVPKVLKIILRRSDYQIYCELILDKLEKSDTISQETMLEISGILLSFENKFQSDIVWMILYQIILKIEKAHVFLEIFDLSEVVKQLKCQQVPYKMRFIIPYAARIAAVRHEEVHLLQISKIIENLIDPSLANVVMRYIAAMANNEFGSEIKRFTGAVKLAAIKSAVILLQDEDEDVRILSTEFYSKIILGPNELNSQKLCHPYVCLRKILDRPFLLTVLSNSGIAALSSELTKYITKMSGSKTGDDFNPFATDLRNIYLEIDFFQQLVDDIKK